MAQNSHAVQDQTKSPQSDGSTSTSFEHRDHERSLGVCKCSASVGAARVSLRESNSTRHPGSRFYVLVGGYLSVERGRRGDNTSGIMGCLPPTVAGRTGFPRVAVSQTALTRTLSVDAARRSFGNQPTGE